MAKLALLQKLLADRQEAIILHNSQALCSCGVYFDDFSDIENHLVHKHEKMSKISSRKGLPIILKDIINRLSQQEEKGSRGLSLEQQLDIKIPDKAIAISLDEDQIAGGQLQETHCHECSAMCLTFKSLKDHYLRQHPGTWASPETCHNIERMIFEKPGKNTKYPPSWKYLWYCPIPGCQYHVNQPLSKTKARGSFHNYSELKQHYNKKHAHRSKICERCDAGFATDVYLSRHRQACGVSFSCDSCSAVFKGIEGLQTHCRRKGHQVPTKLLMKRFLQSPQLSQSSQVFDADDEDPLAIKKTKTISKDGKDYNNITRKYVKIAPMPSLTMTAALALSELSTMEPIPASSTSSFPPNQPQTSISGIVGEAQDKLSWSAAGTQTSPRVDIGSPTSVSALPEPPEMPDESIVKAMASTSTQLTVNTGPHVIPKLGDIEQFSTETQTDDLEEMLLKPTSSSATVGVGQDPEDGFTIEAQTQFDLDDILCSNYTQTALFDTSLDQNSGVNSAETQTMLMSYDLVNMETQTMSMLFDSDAVND